MQKRKDYLYKVAANLIKNSKNLLAFTGAGISVESGIPPFRGKNGLWSKYPEEKLYIDYFLKYPEESWRFMIEIFYNTINNAKPNKAHIYLAQLEKMNILKGIITQNIDYLHQKAGSLNVVEFHGSISRLICINCGTEYNIFKNTKLDIQNMFDLNNLPLKCKKCNGILKPDIVFFGEQIPVRALEKTEILLKNVDVMILIGTTGIVYPAAFIPYNAKSNGAKLIEINIEKSQYTDDIVDVFLQDRATKAMEEIIKLLKDE